MSLSVLFVTLLMLYGSMISGQALSTASKARHRALQDVRALMEQMAVIPLASIPGTFPDDTPIPEFNNLHVRNQVVRIRYKDGDPTLLPLEYEVVATWTSSLGRPASLTVKGVRNR